MTPLASHLSVRGRGFGELALLSAIDDAATIFQEFTAIGGLMVDAKHQRAVAFYGKYGFLRVEEKGFQLFLPIQDCVSLMDEPHERQD